MVKPVYYVKMNSAVKKLTGIGDEMLMTGISFPEAYERFTEFCGKDFCLMSWGNDDIIVLRENMTVHGISTDIFPDTYNLQRIFGRQVAKTKKQISLEDAVDMLSEPPYVAHDALNDAVSAARVCRHLDLTKEAATVRSRPKRRRLQRV